MARHPGALPGTRADASRLAHGNTFPASSRVKQRPRFLEVQQRGRKIHTDHFVVTVLRRPTPEGLPPSALPLETRLGITVTKKVATAVGRNRVKRVVREVFRCNRPWFPQGSDVVVIAKDGAAALSLVDVRAELESAMQRMRGASNDRRGRP